MHVLLRHSIPKPEPHFNANPTCSPNSHPNPHHQVFCGRQPNRGTETCAVVEALLTLTLTLPLTSICPNPLPLPPTPTANPYLLAVPGLHFGSSSNLTITVTPLPPHHLTTLPTLPPYHVTPKAIASLEMAFEVLDIPPHAYSALRMASCMPIVPYVWPPACL